MTTNAELFKRFYESNPDVTEVNPRRTQYVVRLNSGLYAAENFHWTADITRAQRFDFMTSANVRAVMILELGLNDFNVEAV